MKMNKKESKNQIMKRIIAKLKIIAKCNKIKKKK